MWILWASRTLGGERQFRLAADWTRLLFQRQHEVLYQTTREQRTSFVPDIITGTHVPNNGERSLSCLCGDGDGLRCDGVRREPV